MSVIGTVERLVAPVLGDRGLELYDIVQAGPVLRVMVDRPGGITLDELATVTREVSRLLDEHDPVPGRYTLEVTSPGLERPLRRPEHFRDALGTRVTIKRGPDAADGERRLEGELVAADGESITIVSADGIRRQVPLDSIVKARTVFEWGPTSRDRSTTAS